MTREELLREAASARRGGKGERARILLEQLLAADHNDPAALNALGLVSLGEANWLDAISRFSAAAKADPEALPVWMNLCEAHMGAGDPSSALAAADSALHAEPYFVPALVRKAQITEELGQTEESLGAYKAALAIVPNAAILPPALRKALAEGERKVKSAARAALCAMEGPLAELQSKFPGADFKRANGYAGNKAGARKVFQQQPTGAHFPYLPAIEFFEREQFAWFDRLEAQTDAIRAELLTVWEEQESLRPYVAFDATAPVNQWAELNNSRRWSAWFFWENAVRNDTNCKRCPKTAAILDELPLLDVPGKAPSVMFSILLPRTRIPPHTGTTNIRSTVHLPLVVPEGCGFRVGSETREWREGEAWAFDDTIEHEAWNDSDKPRAILILDAWNPLLTEAERALVRAVA